MPSATGGQTPPAGDDAPTTRARTRGTVPDLPAVVTDGEVSPRVAPAAAARSAWDVARERWGTPVGGEDLEGHPVATHSPVTGPAAIILGPIPSITAPWHDLHQSASNAVKVTGYPVAAVPVWLFGAPVALAATVLHPLHQLLLRPGRFYAALLIVVLIAGAFALAHH